MLSHLLLIIIYVIVLFAVGTRASRASLVTCNLNHFTVSGIDLSGTDYFRYTAHLSF